jgi:hypothetical protein
MTSFRIAIVAAAAVVMLSGSVTAEIVEPSGALKVCAEMGKRMKAGVKPLKADKSSSAAAQCAAAGQVLGLLQTARVLADVCANEGGKEIWGAYAKSVDFALQMARDAIAAECK